MEKLKYLLILALASLIPGQILRFGFASQVGAITPTDIIVLLLDIAAVIYFLHNKSLKLSKTTIYPIALFSIWAIASNILAARNLSVSQVTVSTLFLLRFIGYFFVSQVVLNLIKKTQNKKWLKALLTIGTVFAVFGFLQLIFVPDLTFLTPLGWDPHQQRIVSTLLDPNYSGFLYLFFFIISVSLFLFEKNGKIYLLLSLLFLTAIILTLSRSSYMAFLAAIFVIGLIKSPKFLIALLLFSLMAFIFIPSVQTRVLGALSIDETSQARVQSWQNAITIFQDSPVTGVGFNTYRIAQANHEFFTQDSPLGGHSGGGTDSSFLLVLATTGIIGFSIFVLFLLMIFSYLLKGASKNPAALSALAVFTALLVHTQFVNSFFFPQIMFFVWFLIGLRLSHDS